MATATASTLSQIQTEIKCNKDLLNKFGGYKYRSAESILESLKPALAKHKASIILSDEVVEVGGRVYVRSTATLTGDNQWSATAYAREAEQKKGMDDAQVTGSSSSYARKYALQGLLALDDGQDADSHKVEDVPLASDADLEMIFKLCDTLGLTEEDRRTIEVKVRPGITAEQAQAATNWIKSRVSK